MIRGADTVLTFEPHPLRWSRPAPRPSCSRARAQGRAGRGLGVRGARGDPVRPRVRRRGARRSSSTTCSSARLGRASTVGENFHFGHRAQGDADAAAAARPLRDARRHRWSRSTARSSARATSAASCGRRVEQPSAPRRAVPDARDGRHGDERGRELGYPTANLVPEDGLVDPGHGVYACRAAQGRRVARRRPSTSACGRRSRAAAASWSRPTCSTTRATSTAASCGSSSSSGCAASGASRSVEALVEQMRRDVRGGARAALGRARRKSGREKQDMTVNIVVAHTDPGARGRLATSLREAGSEVAEAADFAAALAACRALEAGRGPGHRECVERGPTAARCWSGLQAPLRRLRHRGLVSVRPGGDADRAAGGAVRPRRADLLVEPVGEAEVVARVRSAGAAPGSTVRRGDWWARASGSRRCSREDRLDRPLQPPLRALRRLAGLDQRRPPPRAPAVRSR